MKIAVGCDHAGYVLKLMAMDHLALRPEVRLQDFGTYSEERVDYPDIAFDTARAVSEGKADCGVLFCGTGIGMAIAANKIKGIRAAACNDVESARMTKGHNNLNVLTPLLKIWKSVLIPEKISFAAAMALRVLGKPMYGAHW